MSKMIRDSINLIPYAQAQTELFKNICELVDFNRDRFESALNDVAKKYTDPKAVSKDVVIEVFKENGLPSIVSLFEAFDTIDYDTILAFSSYISLLKGTRDGYELVLRLIGFDYILDEWWEEGGSGKPNTFSIDVNLNSSQVTSPYETFQKIKKFTSEYVFPTIDPLGYTFSIPFETPSISMHGAYGATYYSHAYQNISSELVYGPSGYIVADESGENWVLKVNTAGHLKAFKSIRSPSPRLILTSGIASHQILVSPLGQISMAPTNEPGNMKPFITLMDSAKKNWFIYAFGGDLVVSENYRSIDLLLTEGFEAILLESGDVLEL